MASPLFPAFLLLAQAMLLLLPLLSFLPAALAATPCNAADRRAALLIKKALGDPYTIISWTASTDCCSDWYGTKCDHGDGRITSITVSKSEAAGPLPPAVGDLPYLEYLIVTDNPNVTGPIPREISRLPKLKWLWMASNSLTGPIPDFVGRLTKLEYVNLNNNKLSGSIPPTLGGLSQLGALFLEGNQLTGTIPESLGRLPKSELYIKLGRNKLTGPVPPSFKGLKLSQIDLSRNLLTGDPSVLFRTGDWSSSITLFIDLSRNQFQFDLSRARFSSSVARLDLSHNRIYGKLPAQLTKLDLQLFNVSYNQLCGEIPHGMRLASGDPITVNEFSHNKCLCGKPLPPCK